MISRVLNGHVLFYTFLEEISLFSGPLVPLFGLLVISAIGSKARVGRLACMFHHLSAMYSSDLPMVWHLSTSWRLQWQPSHFFLLIFHVLYIPTERQNMPEKGS